MSGKKTDNAVTAAAAKEAPIAAKQEPKFKVEKLRAKSIQLFGVSTSTFDGAFYGHKEEEMSIEGARAVINKWLGKE